VSAARQGGNVKWEGCVYVTVGEERKKGEGKENREKWRFGCLNSGVTEGRRREEEGKRIRPSGGEKERNRVLKRKRGRERESVCEDKAIFSQQTGL
jgi:hypothetical protein